MSIRVLVVDNQGLTRRGTLSVLQGEPDIEVLDEAADGQDALKKAAALRPDLVLMDIVMPGEDGIAAMRAIKRQCPQTQVLILTVHADPELFRKAADAGAVGYVLKDISPANLTNVIHTMYDGKTKLNPSTAKPMTSKFALRHERATASVRCAHGLTEREVDVLVSSAAGLSDKEIAANLFLSEPTVKTYLRALYRRLNLHDRAQAATFVIEKGLSSGTC